MTLEAPPASTSPSPLTPVVTTRPAAYEEYTINYLRERTYGGGNIKFVEMMEDRGSFRRYLIRYPSDGLTIYGFANVPQGIGPFPVLIVLHGYVHIDEYETLDYTTDAADRLTEAGYIVFHPNLRNHPPSDPGDNLFRVGMTVDVLNLIALIKAKAMPPEILLTVASDQIGLWGHSMGGNIVLRVLTVSSDVKAAVLYASMSGDELKNSALLAAINPGDQQLQTERVTSPALLQRISPMYFYEGITTPLQLYHGTNDLIVPVAWAQETCSLLSSAGVTIQCTYYPDENHTFRRRVADEFYAAQLEFYKTYLSP